MLIHTDTLEERDLYAAMVAAQMPTVHIDETETKASRSHARAIKFRLYADEGPGNRRFRNTGKYGADRFSGEYVKAATHDQHGHWMARVYELDPSAVFSFGGGTGRSVVYKDRADFHTKTDGKYAIKTAAPAAKAAA